MAPDYLAPMVASADLRLRGGAIGLMDRCHGHQVPVLLVSAGFSNIIEQVFQQHGVFPVDHVTVHSNVMRFCPEGGHVVSVVPEAPGVTSQNKAHAVDAMADYFAEHSHRRCIMLVGDSPFDHLMCHGMDSAGKADVILRVGIRNSMSCFWTINDP
eukprot:gene7526-7038_t